MNVCSCGWICNMCELFYSAASFGTTGDPFVVQELAVRVADGARICPMQRCGRAAAALEASHVIRPKRGGAQESWQIGGDLHLAVQSLGEGKYEAVNCTSLL